MPRYDIRVDGKSAATAKDEEALRAWLRDYQEAHREDDPTAAHVVLLELRPLAWLRGGRLVARDRFLA